MAAKGKKKNKSKSKQDKKVVKNVPENEEEEEDFDLETMEKMLGEDEHDKKDEESLDDDFKDNEEEEEADDDDDEEVNDESSNENDDGSSDETMEDSIEEEIEAPIQNEQPTDEIDQGEEKCSLDLRNLLAINSHQVNHRLLYRKKSDVDDDNASLCTSGLMKANDDYLLQKASEGCLQLLEGLWSLETEKSDAGPLATLPTYVQTVTPRELVG